MEGIRYILLAFFLQGVKGQSCCYDCTDFGDNPPFGGTVHELSYTLTDQDPTSYSGIQYVGEGSKQMWGHDGWEYDVPVYMYTASLSDTGSVAINCDKNAGSKDECQYYANDLLMPALGRVPVYSKSGTKAVDIRPGKFGAWGGGGEITVTLDGMYETFNRGNLEELFFHEGAHVTLDSKFYNTNEWKCARDDDHAYISTYARDHPTSEDVSETVVPWYAWYRKTAPSNVYNIIQNTIPNRLEVMTKFLVGKEFAPFNFTNYVFEGEPHWIGGRQV